MDNLVGPTDPAIDAKARDALVTSRIRLIFTNPFFGHLAMQLRLENADEWCGTAATDGRKFYYNSKFIMLLKEYEVDFLVGHEILHCAYDHFGRREYRDPQIFNIACDFAVNADLKKHRIGDFITSVPCLYDKKYEGWTSEAIYDDLMQNATKMKLDELMDQLLDEHMDGGDGDGEDGEGNTPGKGRPKMTQAERDEIRQEMKQNLINAAQQANDAGDVPGNIQRMIKELTNPVMPWRELLQTNLTSAIKSDYTYIRPSRRGWHMDAILPGRAPDEEIDVVVAIDMSGSISQKQGTQFLSEVAGMMSQFAGYKIKVMTFDTRIYNPKTYTSEDMENIAEYELMGGGGTCFNCIFEHLKEAEQAPTRLIVFTDCYVSNWGDPDFCPTTFIIYDNPSCVPPYGTWAHADQHSI